MTTIAYKDHVIAYDSRVTFNGMVSYDDFDKCEVINNVRFFICGSLGSAKMISESWFNPEIKHKISCSGLAYDGSDLFEFSMDDESGNMFRYKVPLNLYLAIGSGEKFALTAMDFGASAEQAIEMASRRCIYTGGKIRTFSLLG